MHKTPENIFDEKVSLIYEYDKTTPLFIRMANQVLDQKNFDEAVKILEAGIKLFPNYAAAYILLGKAYLHKENYSYALKLIKKGSEMIYSPRTYEHYLKEIEAIKKQKSLLKQEEEDLYQPSADLKNIEEELSAERKTGVTHPDFETLDQRIERLNSDINQFKNETLREITSDSSLKNLSETNPIISETLAKIYAAQGEYKEAISIYRQLIIRNPERREYYENNISDLNSRLNS